MSERMQGIVRYGRELVDALDRIDHSDIDITLAVPAAAHDIPDYETIEIVTLGESDGIRWEQTDFRKFLREHPQMLHVNLCNTTPFGVTPGITCVHDIMYKVNPSHYKTLRNKVSRLWHTLQYGYIMRHESAITTVSRFSESEIERVYPASRGKVYVVPDAWQHVNDYEEDPDIWSKFPDLKSGEYYFSMATLARNKNGKWILEAARKTPQSIFAIAGKHYDMDYSDVPENVRFLGYVTDSEACSLIKGCKAFLFPSIYEGFGLPPLEALALGADVISSNTTSLPEVLGTSVRYVDPLDYDIDMEKIMCTNPAPAELALAQYSWDESGEKLLDVVRAVENERA